MTDFSTADPGKLEVDHSDVLPTRAQNPARARAGETETVVGVVLAGGQGTRLSPLTRKHAKPAVPFGARHRVIDFALSNLVNSGVRSIYVLLQHHSGSVRNHLRAVWHTVPGNGFVQPLQAIERPFRGTADAVRQSLDRLQVCSADALLVFGADHVYRMDVRQMIDFHRRRQADVTIAALPVPIREASEFGVIGCDADARIRSFLEKPVHPSAMPGDSTRALASMGNYCFNAEALRRAMHQCAHIEDLDFGRHVLPQMLRQGRRVLAYDFGTNRIEGSNPSPGYWRDVGTLDAYFEATLDTLGAHPRFGLADRSWPIRVPGRSWPGARLLRAQIHDAQIGPGALVRDARIASSVIRRAAKVEEGADLDQCIVLDGARIERGARLHRVIVDQHAHIPAHARIGFDPERDARSHFITPSGITVVTNPS